MASEIQNYQRRIGRKLDKIYAKWGVKTEWTAMKGMQFYSPRVDIAVGPFAEMAKQGEIYDKLLKKHRKIMEKLIKKHNENVQMFRNSDNGLADFDMLKWFNYNAKCFLAVEIEGSSTTRKHILGSMVNASALGKVGLVVAWTPEKLKAFLRIRKYLRFLGSVGKNTFDTRNLLILSKKQLSDCLMPQS